MCKNILGISKQIPDSTAKAELGIYPLMAVIVKQIFSYWQHVLQALPNEVLSSAFLLSVEMDRNNIASNYTNIKNLLHVLDSMDQIYPVFGETNKKIL